MKFTKMHGLGNDYLYVDCMDGRLGGENVAVSNETIGRIAAKVSHRCFSVGGDGVILVLPSEVADAKMRIFNADGSEGKMCGNGIRCVAKFLCDHGYVNANELDVDTLSGIKHITVRSDANGKVESATVDMGAPVLTPDAIPVKAPAGSHIIEGMTQIDLTVSPDGLPERTFRVNAVSMGNPHGVVFVDELTDELLFKYGPMLEKHPVWPDRANIEFVVPEDSHTVRMRVWERGSGETMACGTGACATAVASLLNGKVKSPVTVRLLGGDLKISYNPSSGNPSVMMEGPATEAFVGEVNIDDCI